MGLFTLREGAEAFQPEGRFQRAVIQRNGFQLDLVAIIGFLDAALLDERPDIAGILAALGAAGGHVAVQRHEAVKGFRCLISFRAGIEPDGVAGAGHQRHQSGKIIADAAGMDNFQAFRADLVEGIHELLLGNAVFHRHFHQFPLAHHAHAEGRGKTEAYMGIETIGVLHRQVAAAQATLHRAHQIQMADIAQGFAFLEYSHHPHTLHTPFTFCKPQPLQPSRQSRVVSARMAFSYSRHRKLLSM